MSIELEGRHLSRGHIMPTSSILRRNYFRTKRKTENSALRIFRGQLHQKLIIKEPSDFYFCQRISYSDHLLTVRFLSWLCLKKKKIYFIPSHNSSANLSLDSKGYRWRCHSLRLMSANDYCREEQFLCGRLIWCTAPVELFPFVSRDKSIFCSAVICGIDGRCFFFKTTDVDVYWMWNIGMFLCRWWRWWCTDLEVVGWDCCATVYCGHRQQLSLSKTDSLGTKADGRPRHRRWRTA